MSTGEPRLALVHDELTRRGGAERVFEELVCLYPRADIYALYTGRPLIEVEGKRHHVHTTFLQRAPVYFRRHPRRLLPLLPYAAEQLDLSAYDLVITSASAFAKAVVTRANVPHLCYCHTPTRYLWDSAHDVTASLPRLLRWPGKAVLHYLRLVDYSAAQRVEVFIANSEYTRERIATYYRRESTVVYPPIDSTYFTPLYGSPRRHFLVVSRLTPTKHIEQAIEACEKTQVPLVVTGTGPDLTRLKRVAGRHTTFTGYVPRDRVRALLRQARALLQPGVEDFGMATAEALACGTPIIAYARGGVAEVVSPLTTGYLYPHQTVEALAEALRQFMELEYRLDPATIQRQALRFTTRQFHDGIRERVNALLGTSAVAPRGPVGTMKDNATLL